jgi:c(7)-type cytochrome triheme protein
VVGGKLGCRDCHPKLYLDAARSKRVTMKQMEKGQSCGACHDGKRAPGLDDCTTCHR